LNTTRSALATLCCLGLALASSAAATSPGARIALTFDDLPYQTKRGGVPLQSDREVWQRTSGALLEALSSASATGAVFVNCGNLAEDDTSVDAWRRAGHAIGNHTAHHRDATRTPLAEWMTDVRACDGLWADGSTETRWFRFPYLWRGVTIEQRDAALGALAVAGYTTAPVTVDSDDSLFEFARRKSASQPNAAAVRAALGQRLTAHVAEAVAEARQIARDKWNREVPQILLLHINEITAEQLPQILANLERDGVAVIPLAEAMADPVYAEPDAWAGSGSRMWFARTAPVERGDGTPWYVDSFEGLEQDVERIRAEAR